MRKALTTAVEVVGVIAVLAVLFCVVSYAADCLKHECSDDAATPPVIGNEIAKWDVQQYDDLPAIDFQLGVSRDGTMETCWTGTPDFYLECAETGPQGRCRKWATVGVLVNRTDCYPRHNDSTCLYARACFRPVSDDVCSPWTTDCVEYVGHPFLELRGRSEDKQ